MKTIYTAIFGNYDDLKEPLRKTPGWRHICFTDQPLKSSAWEIVNVPLINNDPSKTARYYKLMHYRELSEFTIWIDGTFVINTNLNRWARRFKPNFTAIRHPFDDCIYKDAESCLRAGKGDADLINRQVELYKSLGIPKHNGLIASGILMRSRCERVNIFCREWWEQVESWSNRDQIAYGYANYHHPGVVNLIEWDYTSRNEFIHIPHIGRPWRNEKLKDVYSSN